MPLILDLTDEPQPQESAVQARILSDQAVSIVRQYGPSAVLQATADALSYYLTQAQPLEPGTTPDAYGAIADAVQANRRAAEALRREAAAMLVSLTVISSIDVLVAYLPAYGQATGLSVGTVGLLLSVRAGASLTSRVFMTQLIGLFGRKQLLALSSGMAAVGVMPVGAIVGAPIPGMPIAVRSIIIMLDTVDSFLEPSWLRSAPNAGIGWRQHRCDEASYGGICYARNPRY